MLRDSKMVNLPADVSNPFISKSFSASPSKTSGNESTASLRDGLGRMDAASRSGSIDLPVLDRSFNASRSRDMDRFVPSRPTSLHTSSHSSSTLPTLAMDQHGDVSADASHLSMADITAASISASLGIPQSGRRILSFRTAPPVATHATSHLDIQRNYLLHSSTPTNRGAASSGPGAGAKKRTPPYLPERVLDAPGFVDDYYLNLMHWSNANRVAIGLGDTAYVWDAETGSVTAVGEGGDEPKPVTSVSWSEDGSYLAVGNDAGEVEIWDVDEGKKMRVMGGHSARVPSLAWNGHVLSSGCRDGSIHHHDVRVAKHKVMELLGHNAEVCGMTWRADGQHLASGGNDNVVNCWDGRIGQSILQNDAGVPRGSAKWTKRNHTAAVKALSWCPWQPNLLATGGGSSDQSIHFWSSTTGARTSSVKTNSQVTSLIWSPHSKELLSTHGFPNNDIIVWSYPSLERIYSVPAHDSRVLSSALSPDGCTVATGAPDENLKFWKIWEVKAAGKKDDGERDGHGRGKNTVSIR